MTNIIVRLPDALAPARPIPQDCCAMRRSPPCCAKRCRSARSTNSSTPWASSPLARRSTSSPPPHAEPRPKSRWDPLGHNAKPMAILRRSQDDVRAARFSVSLMPSRVLQLSLLGFAEMALDRRIEPNHFLELSVSPSLLDCRPNLLKLQASR